MSINKRNTGCFAICLISVIVFSCIIAVFSSSFRRDLKSMFSDWSGGLDRTVILYDYNGKEIRSWTGKFDIANSEKEIFFDLNGKRVIIHGGIVVAEEN